MNEIAALIARLQLEPLPHEGGWVRRYYESPERDATGRAHASAIHFLVSAENFSALHRLTMPEVWTWREGAPVELLRLGPVGSGSVVVLGPDQARGQLSTCTVPSGVWQGARSLGAWTLVDCALSPAWRPEDFTLGGRELLRREFPQWSAEIVRLTR